ncbi:MAG TPA: glycosyltransferase family 2 protein [Paracoccaceae bacterium]|nr:glycosyltransferase family 2 protein [Paracoccaceae bacterium]
MPAHAKVTCITSVADEGGAARETLASLIAQIHGALEIILVDDGADAATRAAVADLADPRIMRVTRSRGGWASAWNAGLALATGEWVCFLRAGDLRPPWAIAAMLEAGERTGADLVSARAMAAGPDGRARQMPDWEIFAWLADWMPEGGYVEPGQRLFEEHAAFFARMEPEAGAKLLRREFLVREGIVFPNGREWAELFFHALVTARARRMAPMLAPCLTRIRRHGDPRTARERAAAFDALGVARLTLEAVAREPRARGMRFRSAVAGAVGRMLSSARSLVGHGDRAAFDRLAAFVAGEAPAIFGALLPEAEAARFADPGGLARFRLLRAAPAGAGA